jgi:Uma2 family endonuclease
MSSARRLHYTYAQYLDAEQFSDLRLEYYEGEIFAMATGTPEHGMLAARLIALLSPQLPGSCRVMTSDVKVRIAATGLTTYPDVSIVCGDLVRAADDPNCVTNPAILVEVLSPSTQDYDRGDKLSHYKQLASLQAVLLVAHDVRRVTAVVRGPGGWMTTDYRDGEVVALAQPSLTLSVRDLYLPIGLPTDPTTA